MTSTGNDQNPYQAPVAPSTLASSERRNRPLTILEALIGVVLAITVGGITFVATCGGLAFISFTYFYGNRWMGLVGGACWLIGSISGIAAASFAAIRWKQSRQD